MKTRSTAGSIIAAALVPGTTLASAANSDKRIESSFKNSYVYRTCLKDDSVKITSKDGEVTLSGTVRGDNHKTLARNTKGVKKVVNDIQVAP